MKEKTMLTKAPSFRWVMLILNVLAYGQFFLTVQVPVAFSSYIMEDLGLTATKTALFNTAIMCLFALTGTLGAKVAAKVGLKKCVCLGIIVNIVGALLIPVLAHSFVGYLVCCILEGLCGGIICSSMISSTTLWFPIRQRGLATGILLGILGVGFSIATFFAPRMIKAGMSWQMGACLLTAVPAAVICLIYFLVAKQVEDVYPGTSSVAELLPPETSVNKDKADVESLPKTMGELRRTKMFWFAAFAAFTSGCMSYGFPAFVNGLLVQDKGLDPMLANGVASITFFVTIFGSPLGGIISDRVFKGTRWQTVALGNIMITVMLLIVSFSNGTPLAVAMILAYMMSAMCVGPYWAIPAELGHPSIATEVSGIMNVFGNTGGFTIGFILTALASAVGNYYICLYVCAVLAAISAVSMFFVRR